MLSTYQITKRRGPRAGVIYNYYRCRSTAGGRPPCKGIQYRAWDIEEGVRAILDEPQTWRDLLGPDAADDSIRQAMDAWRVMLWQWQRDWLRNAIEQIEIDEPHDKIAVTFKADAGAAFLLENAPVRRWLLTIRLPVSQGDLEPKSIRRNFPSVTVNGNARPGNWPGVFVSRFCQRVAAFFPPTPTISTPQARFWGPKATMTAASIGGSNGRELLDRT